MTIDELLKQYRESAENESAKGKMFERLMKNFLPYHYAGYIEKVMLWSEFSDEHDLGIDLVAETFNGELWAIQCKFYAETTTIEKSAVDSFISNSGRSFGGRNFSLRIFISTSSKFNDNAKKALKNQTPPVIKIGLEDLRQAAVDWEKISENKPARISRELRDYQQEALTNAQKYFQTHERGKLIMACGTGKTFTALKIAETLTENRGLVLFLVPSLSLMGQTLHEWRNFSEKPIRAVCVCSDKTVARKNNDDDILETNLPLPVTTDPQEISAAIQRRGNFGLTVIFSTYQSLDKVIAAKLNFDLTICDEAHRTAGNSQQDKETKLFSLVHDNEKIISRRRIYMTATPKLYSENLKSAAAEKNLTVWSMDDKQIFGEEFFKISFAKAVHDGWLSNYQILIFAVSEGEIQQAMRTEILEKVQAFVDNWQKKHGKPGKKIDVSFNVDEIAKLVGTINALSKRVTDDSKILLEGDLQPMNKAVAFLPKIVDSEITAHIFSMIEELYKATLKNSEAEKLIDITAEHIDGSTNAAARDEKLSNLKNTPENLCRIISNVRCLSEGVDVPSLDAVIFLTPKKSKVDIIQAVGRALRKADNKKFGYVIIPIIAPAVINGETKKYFEANNEKYATIYEVVRMLGAHDETLNVEVERLQVSGKSKKIKVLRTPEFNAEQMNLPFEIFQTELIAQVVSHAGNKNYWLEWAQKVSVIVQRHTENIKKLIAVKNSPQAAAFENFLNDLHQIINPAVTETDAVDMLAQHLVTRPVFEALFENYSFAENNPVSKSMQKILLQLDKTGLQNDRAELQEFYDNVKEQCRDMGNAENRQKIIVNLYDSFFKMALPLTAQKLGIVYTPVEVVDFILNSVNDVLQKHFACNISSKNVHVLDPFTGTGTFLTRLIQSGLINHADLLRKYQNELHANEIVLLAYYIAAINIENAFHDVFTSDEFRLLNIGYPPKKIPPKSKKISYYPSAIPTPPPFYFENQSQSLLTFNGGCLTDTFQTYENAKEIYLAGMENPLRENSAMIKAQLDQKITVIVGNPPYSVGQRSANDNAQNVSYPKISARIAQTYAAGTNATNKNSLYDSYIKAFRWASDRIGNSGIIGFVTNAGKFNLPNRKIGR